jgi:pyridoxine/pyridoxamine 5'-phosphate oxidase
VRKNIREKLYSASSSVNFGNRIEEIARYYDNYKYPAPAYWGGKNVTMHTIKKVKNQFNIEIWI